MRYLTGLLRALGMSLDQAQGQKPIIVTVAGGGPSDNIPALEVGLGNPADVAVDGSGNVFIAASRLLRVFEIDSSGKITTVAGSGDNGVPIDGGSATATSLFAHKCGPRCVRQPLYRRHHQQ